MSIPIEYLEITICPECQMDYAGCPHVTCALHGPTEILGESTYVSKHSGDEILVVGFACGCKEVV